MNEQSMQHKKAWEYDAYNFWVRTCGSPEERAKKDIENPRGMLKWHAAYFDRFDGIKVANICGSCGKKAVPLALLGADVTIFDISEDNKRYAMETAEAAGAGIDYEVCDILDVDMTRYEKCFDIIFFEGGVLHYFHDIDEFMGVMYRLLRDDGRMICSDFHPFTKIMDSLNLERPTMSYFSTEIYEGEMAHAHLYDEETRKQIPKCSYRRYTISEILNSIIRTGFRLERFDEHPAWEDKTLPGEFTAVAIKE